jgi:hypothetical protein
MKEIRVVSKWADAKMFTLTLLKIQQKWIKTGKKLI